MLCADLENPIQKFKRCRIAGLADGKRLVPFDADGIFGFLWIITSYTQEFLILHLVITMRYISYSKMHSDDYLVGSFGMGK